MKKTCTLLSALALATSGYAAAPPEAPGLKFTGFLQYRYEWTKNPELVSEDFLLPTGQYEAPPSAEGNAGIDAKSETQTTLWMNVDNQFNGSTRFHGALVAKHLAGRTTATHLDVFEAYVAKTYGPLEIGVGRFLIDTGLGLICGSPFEDGVHIAVGNEMVEAQVYLTKFGVAQSVQEGPTANQGHMTFASGDIKVMPLAGLTLCASFFRDVTSEDTKNLYKAYTFGAEYRYVKDNIPWFSVMGQYAKNTGGLAKILNTPLNAYYQPIGEAKDPKGFIVHAKVLGANPFMVGTGGLQLQYRNGDAGLDPMGMSNPMVINNPFNWMSPSAGGILDNYKGFELTGEVTVADHTILKAAYGFMKVKDMNALACLTTHNTDGSVRTNQNNNYFTAQIFYLF